MNRILIIGATGNVGRHVLSQLAFTNAQARVLSRNPDAAAFPPQVEVVRGDLTLPETLSACLEEVDTVFLVWVAPSTTVAPALQRIAQRARRIVFLSAPLKTPHPLFQQPNAARALGERIKSLIEAFGGKELLYRAALHELARRLDPDRFVRIHRSAIVNIESIVRLEPISHGEFEVILKDGSRSKISRTYRSQLEKRLGQSL